MKSLRKPLILTIAGAALIVGALIESFNYLAFSHRDQVILELQKVLGDDVSIDGLEVNLWGRPGFVATQFRVADDNHYAATPVVRARELILGVSLWNLLQRRLVITSLTFDQPEFQVITDEFGSLNLNALIERKTELRKFPKLRAANSDRKPIPISFSVNEVAIIQGRIHYVDRSVRQPAELQVRNVSMRISGFQAGEPARIQIGASLTPGLRQDVRIRGQIEPATDSRTWLERGIDLSVQIDSLHVPVVARAVAALRDRIPNELDVTGPMALEMIARGTFDRPSLEKITLKVPLFGSTEYNAIITGRVQFNERRSWEEAKLSGALLVDPLSLNRLRSFAVLEHLLPAALITEGTAIISSRFEGTWENLRIGALVLGDKTEVRYKDWLHKAAEEPLTIRARMTKSKQRFVVHPSEFQIHGQKLNFSGAVEHEPGPLLRLSVTGSGAPLATWGRFVRAPGLQATAGKADVNIIAQRDLGALSKPWDLRGTLRLQESVLKQTSSGRTIDGVQGRILFEGTKARLQDARLRLGHSNLVLESGEIDLGESRLNTAFRADVLHVADLPGLAVGPALALKYASGNLEATSNSDRWRLSGNLAALEGSFNGWPLHDLRAQIEWDTGGMALKRVEARIFQGLFRAEGFLPGAGGQTRPLVLAGELDGLNLRALLSQWFPPLRDRVEGRLFGHGRFEAAGPDAPGVKDGVIGTGQAEVRSPMIRNFNLASQLLMKGSDSTTPPSSMSRMPPGLTALLQRRDTVFDSIKADFRLEQNRIFSDNLVISTADYTITGAGWAGSDRSTRWNGMLVLSPRLTQEVQREYRGLRYLLDRRGRLAVDFRVDGQVPNLSVRLENRALAQALGFSGQRGGGEGTRGESNKGGRNWIPDALERYLNR